jgi:hypothetical protein
MNDLAPFMAFWAGYNTARMDQGLPAVLYGEAHDLWQSWQELPDHCRHSVHPRSEWTFERLVK